jgi:UDP-N-acetylmuramoyl-tripeptide--D-alanyl-D-alanine ligase
MPDASGNSPLWTAAEVLTATGGRLEGLAFEASGVTFDSREVRPGDLFVALKGVRDGHDFVGQAFAAGAVAALTERPVEGGASVVVADTLKGLEALGAYARDRAPEVRRGAVTGSVGKTSVTQAIRAGLGLAGPAHSSVKSFNNHIGVPLTLARMPRETERAVFEIGMNHAGEIGPLSRMVQPHAACITNVGPVHTEAFEDGEAGVARAKAEIFEGLGPGGVAVINADIAWFDVLKQAALHHGARVMSFGSDETCDARLIDFQPEAGGARVSARVWGRV